MGFDQWSRLQNRFSAILDICGCLVHLFGPRFQLILPLFEAGFRLIQLDLVGYEDLVFASQHGLAARELLPSFLEGLLLFLKVFDTGVDVLLPDFELLLARL